MGLENAESPDDSEVGRLDRAMAHDRHDESGLSEVQRDQLDHLLIEAGDDPHIRAALAAMFYISLHQLNAQKQHSIAHREALRDDIQMVLVKIEAQADNQSITLMDVSSRLGVVDNAQELMQTELHQQRITIRALAWMLWGIVSCLLVAIIIILVVIIL